MGQFLDEAPRGKFLDEEAPPGPAAMERRPQIGQRIADWIAPPTEGQAIADIPRGLIQGTANVGREMWNQLKTPTGALSAAATVAPSVMQAIPHPALKALGAVLNTPAGRTLLSGSGAAGGAMIEGKDPLAEGGATMGWNALMEMLTGGASKVVRSLPSVKGRIAEGQAKGLTDAIRSVSPELAGVIEGNRGTVAPTLRGPKTSAALQETALGKSGQEALSGAFERGMVEVDALAPGTTIVGPALDRAYAAMPRLAQDQLVGPVAAGGGFTPRQAQEIISWLGGKSFAESPLGQGVGKVPQQKLWADALQETVSGLPPDAADVFVKIRAPYAGGMQYLDMLRSGSPEGPFRSYGNRLNLDENMVRGYTSGNRMELAEKLGPEGFAALMKVLGGAQPGTKSLMAPGGGGATDALAQVYGRGQGGAPQVAGSLLRTVAPNIGYRPAGRAPYTLPPALQAILDAAMQSAGARP